MTLPSKWQDGMLQALKSLYGGVSAPLTGHENARWQAGANEETQMNQMVFKTIDGGKPSSDSIGGVIHALLARSGGGGVVSIAPGIAQRIIDESNFEGQRKVKDGRVQERVQDIEHGRWKPQVCAITFAETPDGKVYLINGQHRCHAISQSGRKVDNAVTIIPVADLAEVRRLYALFDTPESKRSDSEMLEGAGVGDALGLKTRTTAALFKALTLLRNNLEPVAGAAINNTAKSRNGRLEDIGDWVAEARLFESLVAHADYFLLKKMQNSAAMAVSIYLLRHRRKEAIEFIRGIAENDGLRKSDPRARLIADFSNRSLAHGSLRQGIQQVVVAWNAFYEGRDLSIIKCVDGAPIVIKGTPKGGRK